MFILLPHFNWCRFKLLFLEYTFWQYWHFVLLVRINSESDLVTMFTLCLHSGSIGAKSEQIGAKSEQNRSKSEQIGAKSEQIGAKSEQIGAI